mgnify:FL=1
MDQCAIFIALAKKTFTFNNKNEDQYIQYATDPNIIAYGELPSGAATEGDGYVEFNIPLKYKNLTDQPTHIIVVCSSSKYGDYMTGGVGSTLYVDDLSSFMTERLLSGNNSYIRETPFRPLEIHFLRPVNAFRGLEMLSRDKKIHFEVSRSTS